MNRRRIISLLLVLVLVFPGCSNTPGKADSEPILEEEAYLEQEADRVSSVFTEGDYTLYYMTGNWTSIKEDMIYLDFAGTSLSEEIDQILELLSDTDKMNIKDKNAASIIPEGLEIEFTIRKEMDSQILCLYMNEVYSQMTPNQSVIFRTCVSKAIFGLGQVQSIEYYDAQEDVPKLMNVSYAEDPVLLNQYDKNFYTDEVTLSLYFANAEGTALVLEERTVTLSMTDKLQEVVIRELIKGPENEEHMKLMPEGTQIQSVWMKDDVCYVDLNEAFRDRFMGASATGELVIYSIVNSINRLSGIQYVQILIDGERIEQYTAGVSINAVLSANPDLVAAEE